MKKLIIFIGVMLYSSTITQLLTKIENTPDYKIDKLFQKEIKINQESVINSLYPTISVIGSIEHFNTETSLIPITPTKSADLLKQNQSLPFSKDVMKIGVEFSFPLFVKSIYDNKNRLFYLLKATKYQTKIELLKKQTLLIGLVSKIDYLFDLKKALQVKRDSIKTTLRAIKKGVEVGREAEFKLLKLKDSLILIDVNLKDISKNIIELKSKIFKLTQININSYIYFQPLSINKGDFFALKPLKEQNNALKYKLKSQQDTFLPKLFFKIKAMKLYGKAYNTNDNISENFASGGIYLEWDIFDKKNNSQIKKVKLELLKNKLQISKTIKDLKSDIVKIDNSLIQINKQIDLINNSLKLKKELLKGAKVAFRLNRMSVDDYLRYEDDLAQTKAKLSSFIAIKNSLIAQKALIYGKNLKKVFR